MNRIKKVAKKRRKMRQKRDKNASQFIIKSHRPLLNRMVEFLVSVVMWMYMFSVISFFTCAVLGFENTFFSYFKESFKMTTNEIRLFMIETLILFFVFFLGLMAWRYYNKIRFGTLNRRIPPVDTLEEEMLGLQLVDQETYNILKNDKIIIFEKNPVREL